MASRTEGQEPWITLNTDPVIVRKLADLKKPCVDIDIQFIAENYIDRKPRKFRLTSQSWDDLNLAEIC
jgi:hypothetical protein